MNSPYLRSYGTSAIVSMVVFDTSGSQMAGSSVFAAGDVTVSIDGASAVNSTNLPVDRGSFFELSLTQSELTGRRIAILFHDLTAEWLDDYLIVETYGNASSQHPYIGMQTVNANVTEISSSSEVLGKFYNSLNTIIEGIVVTSAFAATQTQFAAIFSNFDISANDLIKNRSVYFFTGNLMKSYWRISQFNSLNDILTVNTMADIPISGSRFLIV